MRPALAALLLVFTTQARAAEAPAGATNLVPRAGLLLLTGGRQARSPFHTDAVELAIVTEKWSAPRAGDTVSLPNGSNATWQAAGAKADGTFSLAEGRGGYLYLPVTSDRDQAALLKAAGHSMVYVNGEPRPGDLYRNSGVPLPVHLRPGTNDMLFVAGRGDIRVELFPTVKAITLAPQDTTLPDLLQGRDNNTWGAVIIVNGTAASLSGLALTASTRRGKSTTTPVPEVLPYSIRKAGFQIRDDGRGGTNRELLTLVLSKTKPGPRQVLDSVQVDLRVRRPGETYKRTFVSEIDGSVQYFAVTPAYPVDPAHPARALVLSLHGASVEALGQASAYAPKTWAQIIAPTNRRPYGFDWEDWGRRDALEVLDIAQREFGTDPGLTYLTGHSMGGHGAWQIGATCPDRFAAIGPSAGWISFFSYVEVPRNESTNAVRRLLQRAATPMDTLVLASNYLHHGIYILHGEADDNVPVSEARAMRKVLEGFHSDFKYHEQPGAGHWWGNACVDWPPLFDLLAHHRIPGDESVHEVNFTTANPGVSASSHWAFIEAQEHPLARSSVRLRLDRDAGGLSGRFSGATENVARLALKHPGCPRGGTFNVELDGQQLTHIAVSASEPMLWFARERGFWRTVFAPCPSLKGPARYGPFKEAFNHRFLMVYGTRGTPEENAWALAKARFDAESFWYRGNGSIDVLPDTRFDPKREPDRGVILYGNAGSNGAWDPLLRDSPVQVAAGRVRVGSREWEGADLACLFLRPRPGSETACVGVVSGSGLAGMKLTDRAPYFISGVAFPDCTVFGPAVLAKGADAVLATGFFGNDWTVEGGDFAGLAN